MIYACTWQYRKNTPLSIESLSWYKNRMDPKQLEEYASLLKYRNAFADYEPGMAKYIKDSMDDSFIYILTNPQLVEFEQWIKDFNLEDQVMFKMPRPITNPNHHEERRLTLVVLQSKNHFQKELAK